MNQFSFETLNFDGNMRLFKLKCLPLVLHFLLSIKKMLIFVEVKNNLQIFIYFLAMVVAISPLLAFTSAAQLSEVEMEMDCCIVETEAEAHACCVVDTAEKEPKKCGDEKPCHQNTCHLSQVNVFNLHQPESEMEGLVSVFSDEKLKIDTYGFVAIKEISLNTWKPPKINS